MSEDSIQVVHFHQKHYNAVMRGAKVTTVRWQERVSPGSALFVFDWHPTAALVRGRVVSVESYWLPEFSAIEAKQPADTDMEEFVRKLRSNYYPTMPEDTEVDVVTIAIDGQLGVIQPMSADGNAVVRPTEL